MSDFAGLPLYFGRHAGGGFGNIEDVVDVAILDHAPIDAPAIRASGGDNGNLAVKGDELFQYGGHSPDGGPRRLGFLGGGNSSLPLPVIAEIGGLENRGAAEFLDCIGQVLGGLNGSKGRQRKSGIAEKCLLTNSMLGGVENRTARPYRRVLGCGVRSRGR